MGITLGKKQLNKGRVSLYLNYSYNGKRRKEYLGIIRSEQRHRAGGFVQRQEIGRSGSGGQDFGRQRSVDGETKDQKNGKKERSPPQVRGFEPPALVESFSQLL